MRLCLNALIGLMIVAHLGFFVLESFLWESESAADARRSLNFHQSDQSEVAKVARNQGASNAFLAAGLGWGVWGLRQGKSYGRPVLTFFLAFIAVAGVVGYATIQPDLKGAAGFLVGQTGLALAALACLRLESAGD